MNPSINRFPGRRFYGQQMQTTLAGMHILISIQNKALDANGYTGRRVLGYKLPTWQRPEVWTDDQCVRFIQSIWMGVGLGSFMVNMAYGGTSDDMHMVLLDGQQRLRAIERYWNDDFPVIGDDGNAYFWSEIQENECAHFMRIPFPWIETSYKTDAQLREAYNRHNFGGTAHTEDQRAFEIAADPQDA